MYVRNFPLLNLKIYSVFSPSFSIKVICRLSTFFHFLTKGIPLMSFAVLCSPLLLHSPLSLPLRRTIGRVYRGGILDDVFFVKGCTKVLRIHCSHRMSTETWGVHPVYYLRGPSIWVKRIMIYDTGFRTTSPLTGTRGQKWKVKVSTTVFRVKPLLLLSWLENDIRGVEDGSSGLRDRYILVIKNK